MYAHDFLIRVVLNSNRTCCICKETRQLSDRYWKTDYSWVLLYWNSSNICDMEEEWCWGVSVWTLQHYYNRQILYTGIFKLHKWWWWCIYLPCRKWSRTWYLSSNSNSFRYVVCTVSSCNWIIGQWLKTLLGKLLNEWENIKTSRFSLWYVLSLCFLDRKLVEFLL